MKKRNKIARRQETLIAKQNYILMCIRGGGFIKASCLRQGKEKFHICFGNLKLKTFRKAALSLIDQGILIFDGSNSEYTYFRENK